MMQDSAQLGGTIWIEFFKSGLPGVAVVIGAVGTFVTSLVAAINSVRSSRKTTKIQHQTNGHLSQLRADLEAERLAHDIVAKELAAAYAIMSAREGKPIADLRMMVRAGDDLRAGFMVRKGNGSSEDHPRRRRNDPPVAREREEDQDV